MTRRDELIAFLDELLVSPGRPDYGPNGLQVPGGDEVELVVTGVSAHHELFEQAAAAGAQFVLCHHGIFWGESAGPVTEQLKARLKVLFDHDMTLAAYHLPLDGHPEVGNNALICEGLGLQRGEPFGMAKGLPVGWVGQADQPLALADLVERAKALFGADPLVFDSGPAEIRSVGIVSGGGSSTLAEAVAKGLDAFVTGEPTEHVMADAREGRIHFLAGGHYASETFGVKRLGELLAERFGVEHRFIEVPNPI
ncbi:MAG: Nif3-like dinuclear metal center hexameric protein [Thermoleophilaceae bacterium]